MSSRPYSGFVVVAVFVGSLALTGCSDMITFAGDNRDAGIRAYKAGDYPMAAGAFRNALRQDPRDYQSHYWLGISSLQLGNYQQAMVAFRSCLETRNVTLAGQEDNGTVIKALDGLAQAIVKSDESDAEVNKVEQAARNAQGAKAGQEYFVLAKVYRYRKLPDMAIDYYNRACLADGKNFDYHKEAGLYLEQLQQTAKAEQTLRQAYAMNAQDDEVSAALVRLGVVLGPSLKNKGDLASPLVPKGPIPPVNMEKVKAGLGMTPSDATPTNTAVAPRD